MLIDYVMPYALQKESGKADSVVCKLRHLAELRPDCCFRLFVPRCEYDPELPGNVVLISQNRLRVRILQEMLLNVTYLYFLVKKRPACLIVRPDALFVGHVFAKMLRIHLVLNVHACVKEESKYVYRSVLGRLYIRVVHAIFCLSVRLADGIVFNHPDLQEYVTRTRCYRRPTEAIYNGANTTRFYPMDRQAARQALSIPADKTVLLFLGSVAKWHGVEYLVEMASVLQTRSHDILIYVVGAHSERDPYLKTLTGTAPENVIFTGRVDIDQANLYVNAADICLLPVKKIRVSPGSPRKLFDYIAAGKPVVAQEATTGYSDLVLSYQLVYTVDFSDSHSAAEKLLEITKECDGKYYETHNRAVALDCLNWRNVAMQWFSFIDKVVSS